MILIPVLGSLLCGIWAKILYCGVNFVRYLWKIRVGSHCVVHASCPWITDNFRVIRQVWYRGLQRLRDKISDRPVDTCPWHHKSVFVVCIRWFRSHLLAKDAHRLFQKKLFRFRNLRFILHLDSQEERHHWVDYRHLFASFSYIYSRI